MTYLFDQRFPADLGRMMDLRTRLRDGLALCEIPAALVERVVLVVDEVVTNSIEHGEGYRKSEQPIRVAIRQGDQGLEVEVDDLDVPPELVGPLSKELNSEATTLPAMDHERGRGMFLVGMFLEGLRIAPVEGGGMRLQGRLIEEGV